MHVKVLDHVLQAPVGLHDYLLQPARHKHLMSLELGRAARLCHQPRYVTLIALRLLLYLLSELLQGLHLHLLLLPKRLFILLILTFLRLQAPLHKNDTLFVHVLILFDFQDVVGHKLLDLRRLDFSVIGEQLT